MDRDGPNTLHCDYETKSIKVPIPITIPITVRTVLILTQHPVCHVKKCVCATLHWVSLLWLSFDKLSRYSGQKWRPIDKDCAK
eukprot:6457465-Amphidinium_carterae.3